ncbi:unnamed protein product [Rhizophagus irregularis]|nr:unnamed protein product [Rhizophagus irregularis]
MGKGGRGRVLGGLPGSEEWKRTKIRSGWLPSSEKRKEPSFVRPFGFGVSGGASEFRRMKKKPRFVSLRVLKNRKEPRFISLGGLPIFGKSGTKIRSGGFSNSEVRKRTKIYKFWVNFRRSEEKEPKFVQVGFQVSENGKRSRFVGLGGFLTNG